MKTTNLEEVRIAMETYYEEVRLTGPSVCIQERKLLSQSINGMFWIGFLQLSCTSHCNQIFIDILIASTIYTLKNAFSSIS